MRKKLVFIFIVIVGLLSILGLILIRPSIDEKLTDYRSQAESDDFTQIGDNLYYVEDKSDIDIIEEYLLSKGYTAGITECSFNMDVDEPPQGEVLEYQHLGKFYHLNITGAPSIYVVVDEGVVKEVEVYY